MRKKSINFTFFILLAAVLVSCSGVPVADENALPESSLPTASNVQETTTPEESMVESIPCDLPLPAPDNWEVVLCETFDSNDHGWDVEVQDNEYSAYTSAIVDGQFVVDYKVKGFTGFQRTALTWFPIGNEKNFALSLKGYMDDTYQDASWGIAFRGNGDSFFLFSIVNNGSYTFEIFENDIWIPLITPKNFNGIRLGGENTLRIEAVGQDFFFSINGITVNNFSGGLLEGTEIQLIVSAKEGVNTNFAFDDVVLQR
jgi:hypothetical protein